MKEKAKKITRYFTFGAGHRHEWEGEVFDMDVILEITAVNPRAKMFELFGSKWCAEYNSLDDIGLEYWNGRERIVKITFEKDED